MFSDISWLVQITSNEMVMMSALYQHSMFSCISIVIAHSRHFAPIGQIILLPSQQVFVLTSECCVLGGEATHTNIIVFVLSELQLKPMIYLTQGRYANHYTTDAVHGQYKLHQEMTMMSTLYQTNTLRWMFIVLAH